MKTRVPKLKHDIGLVGCGNIMIVYKITNRLTSKSYVGYTKHTVEERWKQHFELALKEKTNRKFYNAIRKHGIDCWDLDTIVTAESAEEAKHLEIHYIDLFGTYDNGYNSTRGGDGNNGIIMSEESNLARSQKLKGRKKSKETVEKFKARTHTAETKKRISERHRGMKKPWVKWTPAQIRARSLTQRALTKEQYDLIHKMRSENITISEIASTLSISADLVKKWARMDW